MMGIKTGVVAAAVAALGGVALLAQPTANPAAAPPNFPQIDMRGP